MSIIRAIESKNAKNMMAYEKEFAAAVVATKELGIAPGKVVRHKKYALSKEMADFIQDEIVSIGEILGYEGDVREKNCMTITCLIVDSLRKEFKCSPVVTLGYVTIDNEDHYKFDLNYVKQELAKGPDATPLNVHCWITFTSDPYFELLDLTLTSTLAIGSPAGTPVRVSGWFQPDGIFYHPLLVGTGFIKKTACGPVSLR